MRVGSLFSGYGGLDLAVGGDLVWYSENNNSASRVMAGNFPGVPNLGDITKVNWDDVPPVDVITAGYPCQPFSNAGNRKGTSDERHLWPYVRDALSAIRPHRAVLENVRGHLSLGFDIVLADLADLGWSARWGVVRASDAGAPHQRARLFIVAHPNSEQDGARRDTAGMGDKVSRNAQLRHAPIRSRSHSHGHETGTWGAYAPAVERWSHVIGRPAPPPTLKRDRQRLNPAFVEWMMGLPEGWVTGHDLSASQELKMLGNGVVPQQAALALHLLDGAA